nr:MAG TPA: hypothetical protein [Caudoviricetes sp.]
MALKLAGMFDPFVDADDESVAHRGEPRWTQGL